MSEPLKVGDRVIDKVSERAATIIEKIGLYCSYRVKYGDGSTGVVADTNVTRIRTFEEICKELAEKPCMSDWKVRFMDCGAHYADFECDYLNPLLIYTNGEVWWTRDERQAHLSAAQLAAISAACTEIAANYQAEHEKERE